MYTYAILHCYPSVVLLHTVYMYSTCVHCYNTHYTCTYMYDALACAHTCVQASIHTTAHMYAGMSTQLHTARTHTQACTHKYAHTNKFFILSKFLNE